MTYSGELTPEIRRACPATIAYTVKIDSATPEQARQITEHDGTLIGHIIPVALCEYVARRIAELRQQQIAPGHKSGTDSLNKASVELVHAT